MDNIIGINFKQYKNVIIRSSVIGDNVMVGDDSFITDSTIGNHCSIERRSMIFNSIIGSYSYTGYNNVIKFAKIGKFTSIGWNVSCGGVNHDMDHLTMHPFPLKKKFGFVNEDEILDGFNEKMIIGNDVWIGSSVCILRGITIGNGAVIGAGSVVTHDVGAYEIWAGVPAKKIGQRYDDIIIERLLHSEWYDYPEDFLKNNVDLFKKSVTLELIAEISQRYVEYQKRGK